MKIKEVLTNKDCIVTNDGYLLSRLDAVDDFDSKRLELANESLENLVELYNNICVFRAETRAYVSPEDVGIVLTDEISKKGVENGAKIGSRPANNNEDVQLIDLSATSSVAVTLGESDITDEENLEGYYYFICRV